MSESIDISNPFHGGITCIDDVAANMPCSVWKHPDEWSRDRDLGVGNWFYGVRWRRPEWTSGYVHGGVVMVPCRVEDVGQGEIRISDESIPRRSFFASVDDLAVRASWVGPDAHEDSGRRASVGWHVIFGVRLSLPMRCYFCHDEDRPLTPDPGRGPFSYERYVPLWCDVCAARVAAGEQPRDLLVEHGRIIVTAATR